MENFDNFVMCRDGKEREICPMLLKDWKKVRHFSVKFNVEATILNILTPAKDFDPNKSTEDNMFSDSAFNAMMEILVLAFGEKYTAEEIMSWLDVTQVPEILETFYGISNLKKKQRAILNPPIGM